MQPIHAQTHTELIAQNRYIDSYYMHSSFDSDWHRPSNTHFGFSLIACITCRREKLNICAAAMQLYCINGKLSPDIYHNVMPTLSAISESRFYSFSTEVVPSAAGKVFRISTSWQMQRSTAIRMKWELWRRENHELSTTAHTCRIRHAACKQMSETRRSRWNSLNVLNI